MTKILVEIPKRLTKGDTKKLIGIICEEIFFNFRRVSMSNFSVKEIVIGKQ